LSAFVDGQFSWVFRYLACFGWNSDKDAGVGVHAAVRAILKGLSEPRVWLPFIGTALALLNIQVPKARWRE